MTRHTRIQLQKLLYDILHQSTRHNRACDLKTYLKCDLRSIETMTEAAIEMVLTKKERKQAKERMSE